jgi:hypothetical protein
MMASHIITLCYRKLIDVHTTSVWEKFVFEDTYAEFRMQAQYFNQKKKYHTFAELVQQVPGAEKLHFLVSAAISGYIRQLNETIPDVLNNLGKHFLTFNTFQFEIINSDIQDIKKHQVAINFYSLPLIWHDTIGNYLLLSEKINQTGNVVFTHLFQLQPYVSIYSLQTELQAL